jgi:predicted NAD/FAD-dependent oxidoreductase
MGKGEPAMKLSRKSFILKSAAAVGGLTGLSLLSCQAFKEKKIQIPGQLVGANAKIGHMLRDGKLGDPTETEEQNIVIVGGGIAGLSAARKLQKSGIQYFALFELEDYFGGNSTSGATSNTEYPWGAHYLPIPNLENRELLEFLEEHEIITGYDEANKPIYNEYYLCFEPNERLYLKGYWQDGLVPEVGLLEKDKVEMNRFFSLIQSFRTAKGKDDQWAFTIPVAECSQDETYLRLDKMTMQQYLEEQGFQSGYLFWYANYCCRDDYGSELKDTSAWAGIHYFAARKALAANAEPSSVLTWPEGNGFLVKQLRKNLDHNIRSHSLIYRVALADDHVLLDTYDWKSHRSVRIRAKQVILAVPQFVVQRLLALLDTRSEHFYEQFTYAPWMVANITLKNLPADGNGQPLSWDNVLYDSPSLGYVYANHMSLLQNPAKPVITYYLPLSALPPKEARIAALGKSQEAWAELIVADLSKVHPGIAEEMERIDVKVWGHGMIRPTPGFITGSERKEAAQPLANKLFFAHSDLSGISIFEEAFYQGNRAAAEVMAVLKKEEKMN